MNQHHDSSGWFSNVIAWLWNFALWFTGGPDVSPMTVLIGLATLMWTVEKIRTERAKRAALDDFRETNAPVLRKLWDKMTGHGDLR